MVRSHRPQALAQLITVAAVVATLAAAAPVVGAQELPVPQSDPGEVRSEAERILSAPEFQPPEPGLLDRITDRIGQELSDLFARLTGGGGGMIIAWVLILGAVSLIAVMVMRALRSTTLGASPDESAPAIILDEPLSLDELRAGAERHEAAGEWKQALLARYRLLVGELIERGRVDAVPGRTSGELRADVGQSSPSVAEPFGLATDLFERAWYGNVATDESENRQFREAADTVLGPVPV